MPRSHFQIGLEGYKTWSAAAKLIPEHIGMGVHFLYQAVLCDCSSDLDVHFTLKVDDELGNDSDWFVIWRRRKLASLGFYFIYLRVDLR